MFFDGITQILKFNSENKFLLPSFSSNFDDYLDSDSELDTSILEAEIN